MPNLFDKHALHGVILNALQGLVDNAQAAVDRAYEAATHEENIAENKYDTLGLEASYLTQGQARRLVQCKTDLTAFKALTPKDFQAQDAIATGALVQLADADDNTQLFFLAPAAGGLKVHYNGRDIMIITAAAPLGKALLKACAGDDVTIKLAGKETHYEVIGIY
ncbi:MAG: GreA/GreB family elongation factor [Pseudomonadota bacterium]|nr:GreA/GreB family elongation factor [Pseudomonadota bacterium]